MNKENHFLTKIIKQYSLLPGARRKVNVDFSEMTKSLDSTNNTERFSIRWLRDKKEIINADFWGLAAIIVDKKSREGEEDLFEQTKKLHFQHLQSIRAGFLRTLIPGTAFQCKVCNKILSALENVEILLHPYIQLFTGKYNIHFFFRATKSVSSKPELTVIIPAYNEEKRIPKTILDLDYFFGKNKISYQLIVVDDGSSDNTISKIHQLKIKASKQIISLAQNMGKGAAVREGVFSAIGKKLLIIDADGATPIKEYKKLADEMQAGADIVIGSRYHILSRIEKKQPLVRRIISRAGNYFIRFLFGFSFKDTQCGFKLLNNTIAQNIYRDVRTNGFGFDVEVLALAKERKFNVVETAVEWHDQEGSKVKPLDPLKVLTEIVWIRLRSLVLFSFVGIINTLIDFGIHNLLILIFGLRDLKIQLQYEAVAFITANLVSFLMNSGVTFRAKGNYLSFFAVSLVALLSSLSVFYAVGHLFKIETVAGINLIKLAAVAVSFVINYFGYRYIVFRNPF